MEEEGWNGGTKGERERDRMEGERKREKCTNRDERNEGEREGMERHLTAHVFSVVHTI